MRDLLLFTLYGPLAAMGEVAVGERRPGFDRPGRSAILGLLAAARGIGRRDEAGHAALDKGLGLAVRTEAAGTLLMDFHTAQAPAARKGKRWATRRDELAEPVRETVLSAREYRMDARHTAALWRRDEEGAALAELAGALRRPAFTLCFGRKSCPLGLPPAPRLIEDAATLAEAFARFDEEMPPAECGLREGLRFPPTETLVLHADMEPGDDAYRKTCAWLGDAWRPLRVERRRDVPLSRRCWQFGLRDVLVAEPAADFQP